MKVTAEKIAKMMDLAVLKPNRTLADIRAAAELCAERGIGCLCVHLSDVEAAKDALAKAGAKKTQVAAVIGFPHGATSTSVKMMEAIEALEDGATEIDMVMNVGHFLSRRYREVEDELCSVAQAAQLARGKVKVILETCLLTPAQIRKACELCVKSGVDFVKTSTGFNGQGATPEAVRVMLDAVKGSPVKVKASGGIRDWATAVAYVEMGVARLGVSAAKEILDQAK